MALSIETEEADRLARELSRLTGESMTDAVTKALRERLERERAAREVKAEVERIQAFVESIQPHFRDRSPVTKEEWDALYDGH